MNQIININQYHNNKKTSRKMLFVSIIIGIVVGLFLWKYFVENIANYDVKIPASANIKYNDKEPNSLTTSKIANYFENNDGKPILIYIYTTWCGVCTRNLPILNEIAREFQNTELKILALAIDRNLTNERLKSYFQNAGDIYFEPNYLSSKNGFIEFLRYKNIKYSGHIPFTALINSQGEVVMKYIGSKNKNYLRNNIIKELYPN